MDLEWIAEDTTKETLAHASLLEVNGKKTTSPQQLLTHRDQELLGDDARFKSNIALCPEFLEYATFQGAGQDTHTTNALIKRMELRKQPGKINLVYARIPSGFLINGMRHPISGINQFQASGLVSAQIEADADLLIPPLPTGISSVDQFEMVLERTIVENQTANKERDLVGYIPTTADIPLAREMVKSYLKKGVRFFGIDYSGSHLNRSLTRVVVSTLREMLKIKRKAGENTDKQYYLHVFDVASCKKSSSSVTPVADVLTHAYGVDSTSGVIWGGGILVKERLRMFNMSDYGAYQLGALDSYNLSAPKDVQAASAQTAYKMLRKLRLVDTKQEDQKIVEKIMDGRPSFGYGPYLAQKDKADPLIKNIFKDVKEIQALAG